MVGSGASGTTVAARLAENSQTSILLLEAGGKQNLYNDIPAFEPKLTETDQNWNYPIVSQKYSYLGYVDNRVNIPQGRVLGGSTAINSMNYYRECPDYYRLWSDITGLKGWTFDDVLPFFLKTENNLDNNLVTTESSYHRSGGQLTVTTPTIDEVFKHYIIASEKLGYNWTHMDGRQPMGTTLIQNTIDDQGCRQSISKVFLDANKNKNLKVLGNSLVTKILFDDKKRAIGVEVLGNDGLKHNVFVNKEVIISAGAIGSPQLLMLSGIGPADHLKQMGIPLVSNLTVGHNMIYSPFIQAIQFDIINQSLVDKPLETFDNIYKFLVNHSGPLSQNSLGVTCFPELPYNSSTYPQLSNGCILLRTGYVGSDLDTLVAPYKQPDRWRKFYRPYLNRSSFPIYATLKRAKSTGRIQLASATDPRVPPIIDPCQFCNKNDIDDLVKTLKLALNIYQSPSMQKYIQLYKYPVPGCTPCTEKYFCDNYLKCIIQTNTDYVSPMGGCRIGRSPDDDITGAVVDENFKVFGVSNLRVICSCIIPVPTEQSTAISQ
ncbi:glucose dehydrogenase [FAD, quinone]-like [Oppia nitens]|uniref:glucose dehydrogenase [FAD, quinone]-like n=1 Tax=Oppia nitens TaxID=1686743 RepID=UPI0023D9F387|nr:glucose dehydrogenase [FAD, quinone]-like [Oppia nitens]